MIPSLNALASARSVSAPTLAPVVTTPRRSALTLSSLWFAVSTLLCTALVSALPGVAQEKQTDGQAGRIIASDTAVTHVPIHGKVPFTNSPSADLAKPETALPVHPEGIEDDFDDNTPTAWLMYAGLTPAQLSSIISSDNERIIDLSVATASPLTFNATLVSNTGAYAKKWWYYYGETISQISSQLTTNDARLISVKGYDSGGGNIRYAAVMISNTGVDGKAWYWWVGSLSQIEADVASSKARLITVDPFVDGSTTYYTAIGIANTGADDKAWWWYINATPADLANYITTNKARFIHLVSSGSGGFDVVMESCSSGCPQWYYYYGQSVTGMLDQAVQDGARLLNLSGYPGCGGTCYVGAMINNSNAITTRVGDLLRNNINGGGTEGLYLAQVNGPVLANLEDGVPFDPASTIKVLPNLYATTQLQSGKVKLNTQITHYTNGPESCPNPPVVSGTENLGLALREMMWHSDNTRTREITDHFGDGTINAYAKSIGMTNTSINQIVGCATPPDSFTMDDAAVLYEGVANQTLLNSTYRGIFYSNMAGRAQYDAEGYDWTALWSTDIPNIINEVAPASYTAAQKTAYMNAMNLAYKAGNYVICGSSCNNVVEDIAIAGWFQLPFCSASGTKYNEYVFGIYFDQVPDYGWYSGKVTNTDSNFTTAKGELLREQIQAGMESCSNRSLDVMTYSPADLVFPATTVGKVAPSKTITVTNNQLTAVTSLSISDFGDFYQTNNCGKSLAAGKSCTITVQFKPSLKGERTGAIIIDDNGSGQPQNIEAVGTGQ